MSVAKLSLSISAGALLGIFRIFSTLYNVLETPIIKSVADFVRRGCIGRCLRCIGPVDDVE